MKKYALALAILFISTGWGYKGDILCVYAFYYAFAAWGLATGINRYRIEYC